MMRLSQFFSALRFSNPEQNAIVVLYPEDASIKKFVLRDIDSTTLALYPVCVHVTPTLIVRWLVRLKRVEWADMSGGSFLKTLFRQMYAQYILACIDFVGAKVVLTNIDNSSFFQYLTRLDSERTYFAIQNGIRTLWCVRDSLPAPPHPFAKISMTNFFCFGQRDIELFSSNNHKIDHYFPVGSLLGGYFSSVVADEVTKPQFDLCLVSQWKEHFFEENLEGVPQEKYLRRVSSSVRTLNEFVARLLDEVGLSLAICTRKNGGKELAFFEKLFKGRATFIQRDREDFSTYRAIQNSKLAIAFSSTILAESFGRGQKVLWCNFLNDDFFAMPEAGISYFCGGDYRAFKDRVLTLVKMPQSEYEKMTNQSARHINNDDPALPAHEAIRVAVINALNRATA